MGRKEKLFSLKPKQSYQFKKNKLYKLGYKNYKDYLLSRHWIDFRSVCKQNKQYKCYMCQSKIKKLILHHLTYERLGNENLSDVVFMCHDCHTDVHTLKNFKPKKPKKKNNKKQKKNTTLQEKLQSLGYKGYKEYLRSSHWKNIKHLCLKKKKYCCFICNESTEILSLHHTTYKNIGKEKINDLVFVCEKCHSGLHKFLDKQKNKQINLSNAHVHLRKKLKGCTLPDPQAL